MNLLIPLPPSQYRKAYQCALKPAAAQLSYTSPKGLLEAGLQAMLGIAPIVDPSPIW